MGDIRLFNNHIIVKQDREVIDEVNGIVLDNMYRREQATNVVCDVYKIGDINLDGIDVPGTSGVISKRVGISEGDRVIVSWLVMERAYTDDSYQVDIGGQKMYIIPYDDIIAVLEGCDGDLRPINGYVIFRDDNHDSGIQSNYHKFSTNNNRDYKRGIVDFVGDEIVGYMMSMDGFVQPSFNLREGDVIMFEETWAMDFQAVPYITLDANYRFIHESKISIVIL